MSNELLLEHDWLINKVINKYTYYFDQDDLYQVASLGLINAYNNYKQNKSTKFSTYAYFYVQGEVNKFIRESNQLKVSKELVKLNVSEKKARDILSQKFGREASDTEVAIFLGIDINALEEIKAANVFMESLDSDDTKVRELYEKLGTTPMEYNEEYLDLHNEINNLGNIDKTIINSRYEQGFTQSEIAIMMGMSQVQVCRKEKEILRTLGARLR